jgi:hypothetical protein
VVSLPRRPAADPALTAVLQRLADRFAAAFGDTPQTTQERRDQLNAALGKHTDHHDNTRSNT